MANTVFKGTMIITHPDGTIESDVFNSSDVSLAYVTWHSNGAQTFYPVRKSGFITDITLAIVAADTTKYIKIYINEQDTGIRFLQSTCFHTLAIRTPNKSPIPVQAGQVIALQAVT